MVLVKKRDYKNGGASYGLTGVRGSIYVSTGLFVGIADGAIANKVVMPASLDVAVPEGFAFTTPNAKAEERATAKVEREAKRLEKKAERQTAKDAKAATREAAKNAKIADRAQKKADRETKRQEKADAKQAAKDAKAAAKAATIAAQLEAVKTTPLS